MTLAEQIELACLIEATARKVGNVHPGQCFVDLTYADFVRAAAASAPWLARSAEIGIGRAVLEAVRATRAVTTGNVNLGICLLLAPLAAVPPGVRLSDGLPSILNATTVNDAVAVYEAIRLLAPGGLGRASEQDVADTPTVTLREAMSLAADRDFIAREYADGFTTLANRAIPTLCAFWDETRGDVPEFPRWDYAVRQTQIELIAEGAETLILRKCGPETFDEARRQAALVRDIGGWRTERGRQQLAAFDTWLRGDDHRRNPGTTADLIAAAVFCAIREEFVVPPTKADLLALAVL